jgi:hypothetical protein
MAQTDNQTEHQQQRGHHETHGEQGQRGATPVEGPGVTKLKQLQFSSPPADAHNIVELMREFPAERDAMMLWLHQHRGNAMVQQVTLQMGKVERELPAGVDLKEVRGSFVIPAGRKLTGSWSGEVVTSSETRVEVAVGHSGVQIRFLPGLHIDATWPLHNMVLRSATYNYGETKVHTEMDKETGFGSGMISIRQNVNDAISAMVLPIFAGKAAGAQGYDPVKDNRLDDNLRALTSGVTSMFSAPGAGKSASAAPVATHEMKNLAAGATIQSAMQQKFGTAEAGLELSANAEMDIDVNGGGSVADVLKGGTLEETMNASALQSVKFRSSGLCVMMKGQPAVKIHDVTIRRGGVVEVGKIELLGKLGGARKTESGLSALGALLALAAGDMNSANQLNDNANNPGVVEGVARHQLEAEFSSVAHSLVLKYRGAVPGIDLAKIFGVS